MNSPEPRSGAGLIENENREASVHVRRVEASGTREKGEEGKVGDSRKKGDRISERVQDMIFWIVYGRWGSRSQGPAEDREQGHQSPCLTWSQLGGD